MSEQSSVCSLCGKPALDGQDVYAYTARKTVVGGTASENVPKIADSFEHVACIEAGRKGQRLRITSDGNYSNTYVKIIQPDDSEVVVNDLITSMTLTVADGFWTTATITFERVELDVVGETDGKDKLTPYSSAAAQ